MKRFKFLIFSCLILSTTLLFGQEKRAEVYGQVLDQKGNPIMLANIAPEGILGGATSTSNGKFSFDVESEKKIKLVASFVGYSTKDTTVTLKQGERFNWKICLTQESLSLGEVRIEDKIARASTLSRINPRDALKIPSAAGDGIYALIKSQAGVSSNNELSSQYSVRGGNFDENLIYVNDIEIYRPFLVKTGQQEGLPFVNSSLVSGILFSAGGFDAKYGDKMSSVLDVTYKKPQEFGASVDLSLLGASLTVEGATKSKKLTYLIGARQKSNQYILNSLQTKGDYKPSFTDVQSYFTYSPSEKWEFSFLGYYSRNSYKLVPSNRETDFGTVQEAYRLKIYFEGQEVDKFNSYMGAFTTTYKPNDLTRLKLIASAYQTNESESYDILGQYWIGLLENDLGSEGFGDEVMAQGVGTDLKHARNRLYATITSLKHVGEHIVGRSVLFWGAQYQYEHVEDHVNEWQMVDSAGFSLPNPGDSVGAVFPNQSPLVLQNVIRADHILASNRFSGYLMNSWDFHENGIILTLGGRFQYWDVNKQFLFSPRASFSFKPEWEKDILFRVSGGWYYQPPFYREMRGYDGELNKDLKAQESIQVVVGADWNFRMKNRPFKLVAETYYKQLDNLVPYTVDNVSIKYSGQNNSHGYAYGVDVKINGEFVPGVDSWATVSWMKTEEDIEGDYYWEYYNAEGVKIVPGYTSDNTPTDSTKFEPGYIPRPTDQRFNFSIFFQDYIPNAPTWKMNLNLVFGTGLPTGPPNSEKYLQTLRMPGYKRVDVGFMKQLIGESSVFSQKNPLRFVKEAWISLEVFNLLQFNNTVSYLWVKDVSNRTYAIPNYLTPRQINLRLVINF